MVSTRGGHASRAVAVTVLPWGALPVTPGATSSRHDGNRSVESGGARGPSSGVCGSGPAVSAPQRDVVGPLMRGSVSEVWGGGVALALGSSCWVASGSASCWDCCVPPEGPDVPGSRLPRAVGSQGWRLLSPLPWVFSRLYALLSLVLAQVALGLCARVCTCAGDASGLGLAVGAEGVARVTEASLGTPPASPTGWTSTASTRSDWSASLQKGARRQHPPCPARGGLPPPRPGWPCPRSDSAQLSRPSLRGRGSAASLECVCRVFCPNIKLTRPHSSPLILGLTLGPESICWSGQAQGRAVVVSAVLSQMEQSYLEEFFGFR